MGSNGRVRRGRSRRIRASGIGELRVGCRILGLELHEALPLCCMDSSRREKVR